MSTPTESTLLVTVTGRDVWPFSTYQMFASYRAPVAMAFHRLRFVGERGEGGVEAHDVLAFLAEAADRNRAVARLLAADHEQSRHLGERMLAHLVIDLFVAQVALDPQARALRGCDDLARILIGVLGDGGDHRLQR